jgi:phenylacetic acid degradation operon negative regulatory protein
MGYGALGVATMISPYDLTKEVIELAEKLDVIERIQVFQARQRGLTDARKVVSTCWDLERIHEMYAGFMEEFQPRYEDWISRVRAGEHIEDSEHFVERFALIHQYRKLPFYDPDLPDELLPEGWLRPGAAALFQEYHDMLTEKSNEYFNMVVESY